MLSFKQLKQEVGLGRILNHYGTLDQLEQKGKSLRGACPFCEASTDRPFSASLEKNAFQCFACKASGNVLDFVARMEGMDVSKGIRPVAQFIEQTFLSKKEKPLERPATGDPEKKGSEEGKGHINPPLTFVLKGIDPSHPFVESLGISAKTANVFGAGVYSGRGMFKNHFVIPILNRKGELIGYNGIPIEGKPDPVYPSKFVKESGLFNLQEFTSNRDFEDSGLILVRDPLQVLVLEEAGFAWSAAYLNDVVSAEQLRLLLCVYGAGRKINFLCSANDKHTVDNLARLFPLFFVRLVRYKRIEHSPVGFNISKLNDRLALR